MTALLGLVTATFAGKAHAAVPARPAQNGAPLGVGTRISPVLARDKSNIDRAFTELRLEAKNGGNAPFHGTMKLSVDPWSTAPHELLEVPVTIEPHATVRLQVPILPREEGRNLRLAIIDASGALRSSAELNMTARSDELVLVDVHDSPFAPSFSLGQSLEFSTSASLVRAEREDATAAGDGSDGWVLPNSYAGYSHASVVLIDSSTLVKLGSTHLEALAQWVDHGGTIALVVSRADDLQHAKTKRFVGDNVSEAPVTAATLNRIRALDEPLDAAATAPNGGTAQRRTLPRPFSSDHVRTDFTGGGVRPSPFGAFVPRGLGSVILLAFDPNYPAVATDAFMRAKVFDLLREAQRRNHASLSTPNTPESPVYASRTLRKALDPNEHFRSGLAFAAGLLCIYAILVGPVLFLRARKRGNTLAPYIAAPVLSGATFLAIIATGSLSRGLSGGVRRITLCEQASGDDRGSEVIYRGFYPPSSTSMRIAAAKPGALLDLGLSDADAIGGETLDRGDVGTPMAFNSVGTRPWRTFIAREFSSYESKGTITLDYTGSDVTIVNRTARTIRNGFVNIPHSGVYYLGRDVKPGATLSAHGGVFLFAASDSGETALREYDLENALPSAARDDFRRAWGALGDIRNSANVWPADRAVLIGELDHPLSDDTQVATDSGLAVRSSRFLIRVVGQEQARTAQAPLGRPTPELPPSAGGKGGVQ